MGLSKRHDRLSGDQAMEMLRGPLEEPAGEWFVNRKEELDLFWKWATGIPHLGRRSYALIGLRRTGKTAILHRLFNRFFHEQERVLPVYISFARYLDWAEPIDAYEFAEAYFTGYVRSYLVFRYRQPELHRNQGDYDDTLRTFAAEASNDFILDLCQTFDRARARQFDAAHGLMQWVINFPKGHACGKTMPTAMIVDEFQLLTNVYNPDSNRLRNLTGSFEQASETKWAPLLVSGSSIALIVEDALGGLLSGRFTPRHLPPLTQEHILDMVFRLGKRNGIAVTEALALELWHLTEGYPYPVECLLNSDCPAVERLSDEAALEEILLYELTQTSGALWSHYHREYGKYIRQVNGDQTTRQTLLWIVKHPSQRIFFADTISS